MLVFHDIAKRLKQYEEVIADDKAAMSQLGMDKFMPELEAELATRLSGRVVEDTGDDQLMGEAAKLSTTEYSQYM